MADQVKMSDGEARAGSALARYRKGARATQSAPWPGRPPGSEHVFRFRILHSGEKQECTGAAIARLAKLGIPQELRHWSDLEDEVTVQILARAMLELEHDRPFAETADELRSYLTVDERNSLFDAYMDFEEEHNPEIESVPPELLREMLEVVKKKDADRLRSFGSRALKIFLLTTVAPLLSSPTGSSGSGSSSSSAQSATETEEGAEATAASE